MRYLYVMSDVHSYYDDMMKALKRAGFNENKDHHIFVHCGDLFDRGPDAQKCLDFVNSLPDERKILIRGNHEDLLTQACLREYFAPHDFHNCTHDTVAQLTHIPLDDLFENALTTAAAFAAIKSNDELKKYYDSLRNYAEVGQYIFVHGWIPTIDKCLLDGDWRNGSWRKACWLNGMQEWFYGNTIPGKTIVCGHWHTSWGHSRLHHHGIEWDDDIWGEDFDKNNPESYTAYFTPFEDEGIIALDACTAYSGFCNCVRLDIKEAEWRSSMSETTMKE